MPLDGVLFNQIVDVLMPHLADVKQRHAIIDLVFFNTTVIHQLDWEGTPYEFTTHLITTLHRWDGAPALEQLLTSLSQTLGTNHQAMIQELVTQIFRTSGTWPRDKPPFPGLKAFKEEDAPIFFGRQHEIYALTELVRDKPMVAVIGASGSGKSSLLQAGVIPRLKQRRQDAWKILRFTPSQGRANDPFVPLLTILESEWQSSDLPSADKLAATPTLLRDLCETWHTGSKPLLLLIDQFEETFTTVRPDLREPFIKALSKTLDLPYIHIVLTLRSDFSEQAINEPHLVDHLTPSFLSRPHPWALREMIEGPAKATGLEIESGLIDKILLDTGSEPGNLALLGYTLDELYKIAEARKDRHILFLDYESLDGVQGAIGKRAETVFESLKVTDKETVLAHVFRDLVEVDERGTATRKRARKQDFSEPEQKLIEAFTNTRLLVMDIGEVEVAHEALFQSWERLHNWIIRVQEDLILLRQMRIAAYNWNRLGRLERLLWSQENLNEVYEMQARLHPTLTDVEQAFLSNPEVERLFREFQFVTSHRQLAIVDRWGKIGVSAIDSLVFALKTNITHDVEIAIGEVLKPYRTPAIPSLINFLTSPDVYVRRQTASVLGELGDASAIPGLIKALKDDNASVRRQVSQALAKIGIQSVPSLIKALNDDNAGTRRQAINTLIELGEESVPDLMMSLKDENVTLRCRVAGVLGQIGDKQAVPSLIIALKDKSSVVRQKAAQALLRLGRYAVTELSLTLKDENVYARQLSAEILGRAGDPQVLPDIVAVLTDKDKVVRQKAVQALVRLGSQTVSELIEALTHEDRAVRLIVVEALGQVTGKQGVPGLIMALKDDDADVRRAVITILGNLRIHEAIPSLIATLADTSFKVRRAAVKALEQLKAREALPSLIILLKDEDSYVRQSVAQVLGQLKAKEAIPDLITALGDNIPNVREQAVEVLGQLGDKKAIPKLVVALKDKDIRVRWAAINALKSLGDKQAVPYLIEMLNDKDPILQAAAFSLVQIGDEGGLQALRARPLIVDQLIRFLQMRKGLTRKQILQTLEAIGTPEAMKAVHQWNAQHSGKWEGFLLAL